MTDPTPHPDAADATPSMPERIGPMPDEALEGLRAWGIELDPEEPARLEALLDHVLAANRRFNLTRITEPRDAWMRHVVDSLMLVPWIVELGARKLLDVGSGGGFPGLPLALVLPDVAITLLEATGKKAAFLRETAGALGLDRVSVVQDRAEVVAHDRPAHREAYDVVTARAVGRLPMLLELTLPFVRPGGLVLAIKGEQADAEVAEARRALEVLGGAVVACERRPTGTIVVIEKTMRTPRTYPRRTGEPKRVPIV